MKNLQTYSSKKENDMEQQSIMMQHGKCKKQYPNVILPQRGRGFFGIGIEYPRTAANIGTLWRSAHIMQADFMFVIGQCYQSVRTDTLKSWKHVPLFEFDSFEHFHACLPKDAKLVGIELDARSVPLTTYRHPQRAVYLLGSERDGLSAEALGKCDDVVQIPGEYSLNVSAAGSIVLYDRLLKNGSFGAICGSVEQMESAGR